MTQVHFAELQQKCLIVQPNITYMYVICEIRKGYRLVDLRSKMAEPRLNSNRNDFMSVVKYKHSSFTRKKSHSI